MAGVGVAEVLEAFEGIDVAAVGEGFDGGGVGEGGGGGDAHPETVAGIRVGVEEIAPDGEAAGGDFAVERAAGEVGVEGFVVSGEPCEEFGAVLVGDGLAVVGAGDGDETPLGEGEGTGGG